jgi:hypothetical protein
MFIFLVQNNASSCVYTTSLDRPSYCTRRSTREGARASFFVQGTAVRFIGGLQDRWVTVIGTDHWFLCCAAATPIEIFELGPLPTRACLQLGKSINFCGSTGIEK